MKQPRARAVAVTLGVILSTTPWLVNPPSAVAACPTKSYIRITKSTGFHMRGKGLPVFKDGPGGTMEGIVSKATTSSAAMTVGASFELDAVVAQAKVDVSATITKSVQITVGHRYTHKIRPGRYGHLAYGSWGRAVHWKRYRDTPQCTTETVRHGRARVPTNSVGWKYWATKN